MRTLTFSCSLAFVAVASSAVCPAPNNDRSCMKLVDDTETDAPAVGSFSVRRTPQPQIPDQELGLGELYALERVWQDLAESAWKTVPGWLMGIQMTPPSSSLTQQQGVFWSCAREASTGQPRCEMFVFAYDCVGCPHATGELLALMDANGFDMFRCGPTVNTRTGGHTHPMMGFVKDLAAGETYRLNLTDHTEFVTFGLGGTPSARCDDAQTEAECEATNPGKCAWDNGECGLHQCKRQGVPGPNPYVPPCLSHCIKDDL